MQIADDKNFDDIMTDGKILLVFSALWCGPCKILAPTIEEIAKEEDDIEIVKMDVDNSPETAAIYKVRSIPTMVIVKNGKHVDTKTGVLEKDQIIDWFNAS